MVKKDITIMNITVVKLVAGYFHILHYEGYGTHQVITVLGYTIVVALDV